jgi:all-trans-retinol 13,14-reductase
VVTSAEVSAVLIEGGRAVGVRLADGAEVRAPIVVSDAGWALTFGHLVAPEHSQRAGIQTTLPGVEPSAAHLSLYVGLDREAHELGLTRSNQWIYPHHDHDANVARYLADPDSVPLPLTYLSFPSAKDPDFSQRHPGKATIEVIGLAPWSWFTRWQETRWHKRGQDYDTVKAQLAERLRAVLLERCPQVAGHIVHAELSTPLSTRQFASHPQGEIYGLAHTPARFEVRSLRPETRIPGLYLTGADVCTAGVGGALMGGVLTASVLARRNLISTIFKSAPQQRAQPSIAATA